MVVTWWIVAFLPSDPVGQMSEKSYFEHHDPLLIQSSVSSRAI